MEKHDRHPDIDDDLMRYRTVSIIGDIEDRVIGNAMGRLLRLQLQSSDPITLVINSPGGSRFPALELHDVIRYGLSAPVRAIVVGQCHSAATFILLACEKRLAMPHARFIIHSGRYGASIRNDELSLSKIDRLTSEIQKGAADVIRFYAERMGRTTMQVKELIARGDEQFDNEMTASEALEVGLITEIVKEKLGIFPTEKTA